VTEQEVRERVAEYAAARGNAGADPSAQVEAALFVEDVFGLRLGDDDMTEAQLGTTEAMVRLVVERLEGGE